VEWAPAAVAALVGLALSPLARALATWSLGQPAARTRRGELIVGGFATAVSLGIVSGRVGLDPALPAYVVFAVVAAALFVADLRAHRLPNRLTLPSYIVGIALLAIPAAADDRPSSLIRAAAGAGAVFAGYLVLHLAAPAHLGRGDVKYAGVLGLHLGWFGWSSVAVGAIGGFVVGGLVSLGLLATRRAGLRSHVPFGPSMIAGALLAITLGPAACDELLQWTA
jgi:leader peptidase (prepilin peptidase)/N-methyltransferase